MWECKYGKEPADLKLLAIQFYRKLWIVLAAALAGAVLFGTGYFIRYVVLAPEPIYEAYSMMYVDFVEGDDGPKYYAFNTAGWSGFVKTDEILDRAVVYAQEDAEAAALATPIGKAEMRESVTASEGADYRVVDLTVSNADPDRAVMIAHAVEKGFLDFGKDMREIEQVRVMTTADQATRILVDTVTYRAAIWGSIIACVIVFLVMAIWTILDDSIYVPITFERRYGIPMLGTIMRFDSLGSSDIALRAFQKARNEEMKVNLECLCKEKEKMAVLTVTTDMPKKKENYEKDKKTETVNNLQLLKLPRIENLLQHPEEIKKLMQYEAVILEIPAGGHNGKAIEYAIAQAEKYNCKLKGAILTETDEKLLKTYYFGTGFRKGK